jgi:hypothetical protein
MNDILDLIQNFFLTIILTVIELSFVGTFILVAFWLIIEMLEVLYKREKK